MKTNSEFLRRMFASVCIAFVGVCECLQVLVSLYLCECLRVLVNVSEFVFVSVCEYL